MGRGSRARGRLQLAMGIVMLFVGLGVFLYPTISAVLAQLETSAALADLRADGAVRVEDSAAHASDIGAATEAEKADDPTYQQLKAYNERVRTGTGGQVNDPFAFGADELAGLGLPDGIVGSINIPAMGVTLPLYLGSSYEHMAQGATVVAGTSIPLGETDSNVVIAAHRGEWSGLAMFRDIEKLEEGDTLTITTPWDTLVYRVVSEKVVLPDDVSSVAIQPGRDLVTLLTCHPYGENAHRLLVFCERVDGTEAWESSVLQDIATQIVPDLTSSSPLLTIEGVLKLVGLAALVFLGLYLVVSSARRRGRRRAARGKHEVTDPDLPSPYGSPRATGPGSPPRHLRPPR